MRLELPRRSRWLLLAPLALVHLVIGYWLNARHAVPVAARPVTVVRLEIAPPVRPRFQATPVAAPRLPLPIVVPIEPPHPEVSSFNPPTRPGAPAQATEPPRSAPLNLALPSPAQAPASAPQPYRNPALTDPRANTRRADFATQMANTLGTDQTLREESLGPGRHRFKQGTTCVETAESRVALIDPFGATMRGSPQLVTSCK